MYSTDHKRICPTCGKLFYVSDFRSWAYKRQDYSKFFCKWSCMREFDRQHDVKMQSKHKEKTKIPFSCKDCVWYDRKYGFEFCHCADSKRKNVTAEKAACRFFADREEGEDGKL